MKILLFADAFPPFQSSAAIQLKDLVDKYILEGHSITVFTTSRIPIKLLEIEKNDLLEIIRVKNPLTKEVNFFRRAIAELLIPITTLFSFFSSEARKSQWDGIIWYSPTIFFGPVIYVLKKYTKSKTYLILRDIFPEWALDVGHLKKGPIYYFFKLFETLQYYVADHIGVQTTSNINYFEISYPSFLYKIEVLNNWLAKMPNNHCTIDLSKTTLANRFNFIYAGNIGSAQGLEYILNFAIEMQDMTDIGFIFVGDGDAKSNLKSIAEINNLKNILFFDSIPHSQIKSLYNQCNIGIISLDHKHKTHNIPGKMLSYIQSGLPIFAVINPGNDILEINKINNIGMVTTETDAKVLRELFLTFYSKLNKDININNRCFLLSQDEFSVSKAYIQTSSHFKKGIN